MVGQHKLKSLVDSIELDKFPHVVLLVGDAGAGKRTFIKDKIEPKLGLSCVDITSSITFEGIENIYLSPIPSLNTINLDLLSDKKLNVLLKFLEEPPELAYIILLSTNINNIIPTVLNRCQVWRLEEYSYDDLSKFTDKKELINFIRTPGLLLKYSSDNSINDIAELSKNLLLKCDNATFSNLLSVSSKFNWSKSDDSKYDLDVFCKIFIFTAAQLFKNKLISVVKFNIVKEFVNGEVSQFYFDKCLTNLKFYGH